MDEGMVSGICVDWNKLTIIMVPNMAPEKGEALGLPGGIIGRNETREDAMIREWKEEVWGCGTPIVTFFRALKKNGRNGSPPHLQHIFVTEDSGRELRKSGVRGETKAPVRVSLWSIAKGNIEVFHSHKLAILALLEYAATLNKDLSFLAIAMDKRMKKIPEK